LSPTGSLARTPQKKRSMSACSWAALQQCIHTGKVSLCRTVQCAVAHRDDADKCPKHMSCCAHHCNVASAKDSTRHVVVGTQAVGLLTSAAVAPLYTGASCPLGHTAQQLTLMVAQHVAELWPLHTAVRLAPPAQRHCQTSAQ
jgi:hypothetical protein